VPDAGGVGSVDQIELPLPIDGLDGVAGLRRR
jgi:hypothetical protein